MTKVQKIWLSVFLAMFLVPEILWSPVGNFWYEWFQTNKSGGTHPFRETVLENSSNINFLLLVLFIQLFGAILYFSYSVRHSNNIKYKWLFGILGVFSFLFAVATFFALGFSNDFRHIGF